MTFWRFCCDLRKHQCRCKQSHWLDHSIEIATRSRLTSAHSDGENLLNSFSLVFPETSLRVRQNAIMWKDWRMKLLREGTKMLLDQSIIQLKVFHTCSHILIRRYYVKAVEYGEFFTYCHNLFPNKLNRYQMKLKWSVSECPIAFLHMIKTRLFNYDLICAAVVYDCVGDYIRQTRRN